MTPRLPRFLDPTKLYGCRRFARDMRGATAVEFGLVAVPFFGLLLAIFETGFVFFNAVGLQAAVQTAARTVLTGNAQAASGSVNTAALFNSTYVCPNLPSFIPCSGLITDIRTSDTFANVDGSNGFYNQTSSQTYCLGGPGQITVVRVAYPMPVFFPIIAGFTQVARIVGGLVNDVPGSVGTFKHLLLATAVFQTEPYPAANYTKAKGC